MPERKNIHSVRKSGVFRKSKLIFEQTLHNTISNMALGLLFHMIVIDRLTPLFNPTDAVSKVGRQTKQRKLAATEH